MSPCGSDCPIPWNPENRRYGRICLSDRAWIMKKTESHMTLTRLAANRLEKAVYAGEVTVTLAAPASYAAFWIISGLMAFPKDV